MQLVIADTGPINYLLLIGHIEIVLAMFEKVILPSAVRDELSNPDTPASVRSWIADSRGKARDSRSRRSIRQAQTHELRVPAGHHGCPACGGVQHRVKPPWGFRLRPGDFEDPRERACLGVRLFARIEIIQGVFVFTSRSTVFALPWAPAAPKKLMRLFSVTAPPKIFRPPQPLPFQHFPPTVRVRAPLPTPDFLHLYAIPAIVKGTLPK